MANTVNNTEIRNWVIYKITSPSGGVYIGKTCNPKLRLRQYRNKAVKSQPIIFRSMQKYGYDNHVFEIIDTFTGTCPESNSKEIFWIRTYMANKHKWPLQNGMNVTDGGKSTLGWKPSAETIEKIRIGNRRPKHTEEWKKANGLRAKGHTHNRGKKRTPEHIQKMLDTKRRNNKKINRGPASEATKLKMSLAHIGKKHKSHKSPDRSMYGRNITQYDKLGNVVSKFVSIEKAAESTGISYDTIYYDLRKNGSSEHKTVKIKEYNFKYSTNDRV